MPQRTAQSVAANPEQKNAFRRHQRRPCARGGACLLFPELETYLTGATRLKHPPRSPLQSTDAADCAVYFLDVGQGDSI